MLRGMQSLDELEAWRARLEEDGACLTADASSREPTRPDGSHDLAHVRRVWASARRLAGDLDEPVDLLVLLAAADLHDVVAFEKNDPRRAESSVHAAAEARRRLRCLGFPEDRLDGVVHAIEAHSYTARIPARTPEARVLQDADRLEALGAIGLARTFYVAGRLGSQLFDPVDPFATRRSLDDARYAVDHFRTKLFGLVDTMQTEPGRRIARQRAGVLQRFLDDLAAELAPDAG
jgi:uncharacterized protein